MIFDGEAIMGLLPTAQQCAFLRTTYRHPVDGNRRAPLRQAVCKACEWEGDTRTKGSRTPTVQMIEHNKQEHPTCAGGES